MCLFLINLIYYYPLDVYDIFCKRLAPIDWSVAVWITFSFFILMWSNHFQTSCSQRCQNVPINPIIYQYCYLLHILHEMRSFTTRAEILFGVSTQMRSEERNINSFFVLFTLFLLFHACIHNKSKQIKVILKALFVPQLYPLSKLVFALLISVNRLLLPFLNVNEQLGR